MRRFTPAAHSPFLAATLLAILVTGCATVGPDYHKPEVKLSEDYQGQAALAARKVQQPAPPLDQWWTGFNDQELERIIHRVLAQNLDLAAAMARINQARAFAQEARAKQLPSGELNTEVSRQHQSLQSPLGKIASRFPGYERNSTLYNIGAGASWELDLFGGLKREIEAANAEAQAAEADQLGVRISVAAEAADAYFRVHGAQRRIALAEEQVKTDSRLKDIVTLRVNGGLASKRELDQADALLAQTRATIPPLRVELATQLNRLDVLMGAQPGTYANELAKANGDYTIPAISTAQGPADLLRRRPDVIAAERRLAASNARIGAATAEYYPKVSLSAVLGFVSLGSTNLISAASFQPAAAGALRWRLFDFGRVDAEVAQAKGGYAEALAHYRQSMLRATEDVENAIITLTESEAQHKELKLQVDAQARAKDEAEEAYEGGATSLFEVLQEDRHLLAARDQYVRVEAENARAAVATFRALGGGW